MSQVNTSVLPALQPSHFLRSAAVLPVPSGQLPVVQTLAVQSPIVRPPASAPSERGVMAHALLVAQSVGSHSAGTQSAGAEPPVEEAKAAISHAAVMVARVRYLEQAMFLTVAAPLQVQTQIPGAAFLSSAAVTRFSTDRAVVGAAAVRADRG